MTGRRQAAGRWFAPRPRTLRLAAVVAIVAVLGGIAIVANGFDVKQTVVDDSSIWALQSGDGNRYARVNTDLRELDTVKTVPRPSSLVQSSAGVMLYAQNNEKAVDVSLTAPVDLSDDPTDYASTPAGTRTVVSSGSWVGYLTGTGGVFTAPSTDGVAAAPTAVDPYADDRPAEGEDAKTYHADAIAIGTGARHLQSAAALEGSWDGESVIVGTPEEAYDLLRDEIRENDVVLVKGATATGLAALGERLGAPGAIQ